MPNVSVVIPTTGRPSLDAAIRSVEAQAGHDVEVIVVYDGPSAPAQDSAWRVPVQILCTGGGMGGSWGRNLGVQAAKGEFVAFLDDDDEWLPGKLDLQLAAAEPIVARDRLPVIGSRVLQRRAAAPVIADAVPRVLIGPRQAPQDYLFRGRKVTVSRPLFPTSTILTSRELARRVPWKSSLRRHQDWQWLIEASELDDVDIVQVEEATAVYTVGSAQSISASPDWEASLAWAEGWRSTWDRQTYADFLAAQVLRYALQSREGAGVKGVLRELVSARTRPSLGSSMSGLLGVIPRGRAEQVALGLAARRGSIRRPTA